MDIKYAYTPDEETITSSNIQKMMDVQNIKSYDELHSWSVSDPDRFWRDTMDLLEIPLIKNYDKVLDDSEGPKKPHWLKGAKINIVDSCFRNWGSAPSIIYQETDGSLMICSQRGLQDLVNRVANGLVDLGFKKGDYIAIGMPMTLQAVAIYLGIIKTGMVAVAIADSFSSQEIKVRLDITNPKLFFTQDVIQRSGKKLPLYNRVKEAGATETIVFSHDYEKLELAKEDKNFEDFLSSKRQFDSVPCDPEDAITILFSSGTTGEPKAIPWNHTTPIKSASDGFYHQNIQNGDVVCWPTNLGWMMGPWLVFASLINEAAVALYNDSPLEKEFGVFVQKAGVTMLGVVPSLVSHWKKTSCMQGLNWSAIKNFSSTGEVSNPSDMHYLMSLAGVKPVIEYCGGTEIGGGYLTGTVIQPAVPGTFTTKALGSDFVILDEEGNETENGEVFIIPPAMGLSLALLNKDHDEVYYKDTPDYQGKILRRHGDRVERFDNGYFRIQGRVDDAMNLGGIKVSAVSVEELVNTLDFIDECAAIGVAPEDGGPAMLVIYAVGKKNGKSDQEALSTVRELIKKELNPLFKLEELIWIPELPRTASKKIMRRKLRDAYPNVQEH